MEFRVNTPWMKEALLVYPIPENAAQGLGLASTMEGYRIAFDRGAQWGVAYVIGSLSSFQNAATGRALKLLVEDLDIYHEATGKLEQVVSEEAWRAAHAALKAEGA